MPDAVPGDDPLDELRERVKAATEAAERIARDAAASAADRGGVPPRGWTTDDDRRNQFSEEVQALAGLLEALRGVLPPELRDQVSELMRQLLMVLRALIDFMVDRMESAGAERGAERPVEDIPIS